MPSLTPLDWIVVVAYGVVVLAIGAWANRRQDDTEDYFLGGRNMQWLLVGVSLVATSFSSVALILGTGFGYGKGMQWLQLQIGDLVGVVLVCLIFLPFFAGSGITTAYEYLERRFGVVARTAASSLFLLQTLLRASILVLSPALALSAVMSWPIATSIYISAGAAIIYSAFGGIKAVVLTDLIQLSVVLFAVGFSIFLVAGDVPGGFPAILHHASETGRLRTVTVSADLKTPMNLLGALLPYMLLTFSLYGTGQQAVQRFLAVKDLKSARRVAFTGWTLGTFALAITLFLGVCLSSWKALAPAARGFAPARSDQVLPLFLTTRLPPGIAGLLLAAIFAASMSSLDSAIHSMSTASIVDFLRRFSRKKPSRKAELRLARFATVACGAMATLGALRAARTSGSLLQTLVTWLGYFAGPLLGLFLLGMLTRRTTERGALIGAVAAAGTIVGLVAGHLLGTNRDLITASPLWFVPISLVITVVVGYGASCFERVEEIPRRVARKEKIVSR